MTSDLGVSRRVLLTLVLLGVLGLLADLLLTEHHEGIAQKVPLVLLGLGLPIVGWVLLRASPAALRTTQLLMLGFVVAGLVGVGLHFKGNREFELEMTPSASGVPLLQETLQGATPVLAPGSLFHLGLLGLLATWGTTGREET